jgi:hypothetical protein
MPKHWKVLPSHFAEHAKSNQKIEFVKNSDWFLLQSNQSLMLHNIHNLVVGIDVASESGSSGSSGSSYPCPSLFAMIVDEDIDMVAVLGQDDFGELYIDILVVHTFARVLRVQWENTDGQGLQEWSSMSVNNDFLMMCSVEGRICIFQFDRRGTPHIQSMRLVHKEKTNSWYCCVDLSRENIALLCSGESDTPTGLQYVDLTPLLQQKAPVFDDTRTTFHFRGGPLTGEEKMMVDAYRALYESDIQSGEYNSIVLGEDGSIDDNDERNMDFHDFMADNVDGTCASAINFCDQSQSKYAFVNGIGTVCVRDTYDYDDDDMYAREYLFLGSEKHLSGGKYNYKTRTAVELSSGTTRRRNGWKYDALTIHNGKDVSIIYMLAHQPDPSLRALFKSILTKHEK